MIITAEDSGGNALVVGDNAISGSLIGSVDDSGGEPVTIYPMYFSVTSNNEEATVVVTFDGDEISPEEDFYSVIITDPSTQAITVSVTVDGETVSRTYGLSGLTLTEPEQDH